ncbi:beta-ketoacyl-[acyl-carrier-protein] synthase family protein [Pseudolysobacter antarcticus]|uniref:Nodulation protein E n=1 Tax=Pseudolysobacter antarcticus TaxID=2511995 RepID=A0A411HJ34_9GAMM|nr:beta-ketoacyl-[acyl-carrier-protein] synthase family protein [Pseudolysobacter antarcticus]QBB70515.1 beta-ketoacyl-[acyl-carrier-protein] synthase family protein [Pseudolysobacter antarcticus]
MPVSRDVVITGMGVISPIGLNIFELATNLETNTSGIRLWHSLLLEKKMPVGFIDRDFSKEFTKLELPYLDRCSQLAMLAAREATQDAGLEQFAQYGQRAGLYFGSVAGGVVTEHDWVRQFYVDGKQTSRPYTMMACMLNAAPGQLSIRHQILGPVMTHSSACTSSGAAIGDARRAIRDGYLDVALVGGSESALAPAFMAAWGGLRALAEVDPVDVARSSKPFSKNRTGLVLSEGAVFFVLESRENAIRRGAKAYCCLSGYGIASDGYHIGSPASGGQVAAMRAALSDANLAPADIGYLNAHATATGGGDPIEVRSINDVFDRVPVSSTKGIHGHLLGAASAIELAVAITAINRSFLPATAHLDEIDPACELNHVANMPIMGHVVKNALSLSAGFGGTNVALIVSTEDEATRKAL